MKARARGSELKQLIYNESVRIVAVHNEVRECESRHLILHAWGALRPEYVAYCRWRVTNSALDPLRTYVAGFAHAARQTECHALTL